MKAISLQQIRQAVSGRAVAVIPPDVPLISAVCTDSRRMEPQSLFIAIKGDTHDGHQHLAQAATGGAIAALVQETPSAPVPPNLHLIQVPDTRSAMGKLATFVRKQMRSKVIGIAGSNGKTSTKYLIHAALCGKFRGTISPKSFNNDIGVPLTIFPADPMQDYLVLEMGTNHHGEIRKLTEMALPDIAVITNCSAEHLEFLGDVIGVRRENASVIAGLNPKGLLVVNGDDPELLSAVKDYPGKRVMFGFKETNDLFATDVRCTDAGVKFRLNSGREIFVPMLGRHTAANALAAIAVGRRMGLSEDVIAQSLAVAKGPDMRLQLQQVRGLTLVNDAYNANPASMRAAMETVSSLPTRGRCIAVLGEMRELGPSSERYHREVGEFAASCRFDHLLCVGGQASLIAESAERAGMPREKISRFADAVAVAKVIHQFVGADDLVLLKASRGIHLETVAKALTDGPPSPVQRIAS